MQLALDFENNHFAQIRRHYQSIAPEPDEDPRQLELFPKHPSSPFDRRPEFSRQGNKSASAQIERPSGNTS